MKKAAAPDFVLPEDHLTTPRTKQRALLQAGVMAIVRCFLAAAPLKKVRLYTLSVISLRVRFVLRPVSRVYESDGDM